MMRLKAWWIGVAAASSLGVALTFALAAPADAPGAMVPDHVAGGAAAAPSFHPPPESAIPDNEFGRAVRRGEAIFRDTPKEAPSYVGNALTCENCHIDAGRLAGASPLWAAYPDFPAYRAKNGHVNTYAERMQGCFRFSMNGNAPPSGDPVLVALEAYSYWLSQGAPVGASLPGRGYPKLSAPATPPDYARGAKIYADHCALCHGGDGAGQSAGGKTVFPPLWGARSFNWGAGMANINDAAGFIKANMPLGLGGLTDQQAWDVARFMDSHERPKDPRFFDSLAATRAKFHDSRWSMYGKTVNGHLLGAGP